jgi:hypothetical protein
MHGECGMPFISSRSLSILFLDMEEFLPGSSIAYRSHFDQISTKNKKQGFVSVFYFFVCDFLLFRQFVIFYCFVGL